MHLLSFSFWHAKLIVAEQERPHLLAQGGLYTAKVDQTEQLLLLIWLRKPQYPVSSFISSLIEVNGFFFLPYNDQCVLLLHQSPVWFYLKSKFCHLYCFKCCFIVIANVIKITWNKGIHLPLWISNERMPNQIIHLESFGDTMNNNG